MFDTPRQVRKENDMNKNTLTKAQEYLEMLNRDLEHKQECLDYAVKDFKEFVASANDYYLAEHSTNKIDSIKEWRASIFRIQEEISIVKSLIDDLENN